MRQNRSGQNDNIYRLAEELNIQERNIMDFSTPVNPLGVSKKIKAELRRHLKYLLHYPDPEARRLTKRLAQYHGITPEMVLCAHGSSELFCLTLRALKPSNILIPAPSYPAYERAIEASHDSRITHYELKRENNFEIDCDEFIAALPGNQSASGGGPCRMAVLSNPYNPTGRLIKKPDIQRIAAAAGEQQCYLVVDEAFMDFCPDASVIQVVNENPYLIVLRTMSAFYALAGLRIGYGIFHPGLPDMLRKENASWTVNNLAQRAAVIALKDKVYRKESLSLMLGEKKFLEKSFRKLGIEYFASDANFYLLKADTADTLCQRLKKKGILLGTCSGYKGLDETYIRVAVRSHKENAMLMKALAAIFNGKHISDQTE
jgi:threonine-phosphate decarboxylase